jgi:hypothetical protein
MTDQNTSNSTVINGEEGPSEDRAHDQPLRRPVASTIPFPVSLTSFPA